MLFIVAYDDEEDSSSEEKNVKDYFEDYSFQNTGLVKGSASQNNHGCTDLDFDSSGTIGGDATQNNLATHCGKGKGTDQNY